MNLKISCYNTDCDECYEELDEPHEWNSKTNCEHILICKGCGNKIRIKL